MFMNQQKYDLSAYRKNYRGKIIQATSNPIELFTQWFNEALKKETGEPYAMALATVDEQGLPQVRMVLLKSFSDEGFVFFTNYLSHKGKQIVLNPVVSLLFFWQRIQRQVRITGTATKVDDTVSDNYFYSRPVESQVAAIISKQSNRLFDRKKLLADYRRMKGTKPVRPKHWGGYVVVPLYYEFWQGMPSRLHDRLVYEKKENDWITYRLYP